MRQERFESLPKVRVATAGVGEEFCTSRPVTRAQGMVELRDLLPTIWGHHHFSDHRQVNGCCQCAESLATKAFCSRPAARRFPRGEPAKAIVVTPGLR